MSKGQVGLDELLVEYRAVFVQLLGTLTASEVSALLAAPIEASVKLLAKHGLSALAKRLTALTAGVSVPQRVTMDDATRGTIEGVFAEFGAPLFAPPPAPAAEELPAPAAAPAARPPSTDAPRHTARAKPPMRGGDVLLGDREPTITRTGAMPAKEKIAAEAPEIRYLVAAIAGHERDQPLEIKKQLLEISIELDKEGDAATRFLDAGITHGKDEDSITLMVQVTSEDFTIAPKSAVPLELPRRGPSDGKARFDVTPKKEGRGTLTVNVHKDGNFLLQMEIVYSVGANAAEPIAKKVHGRTITSASQLQKRDLGMTIKPVLGGYECVVRGSTYKSVVLKIDEVSLRDAIDVARAAMLNVVKQREDGVAVFQQGTEFVTSKASPKGTRVPDAAEQKALATLARAGGALFRTLFFGKQAGADEKAVGEHLRKSALRSDGRLTLQIVAEKFPVPWGVLYLGDFGEKATLSWENFLGMRCIIEQIPLQTDMLVDDSTIASDKPGLAVGVNVNESIDTQFSLDVVKRQLDYWAAEAKAAGKRLQVKPRTSRADVLEAMSGKAPDQLMYLYCHAVTNGPEDPGGITASHFVFTNDEELSLAELDAEAAELPALPGSPLVFINACESGELRPEFYDGFIPYFMSKGARGVIGTECQTPAIFATEWAMRFFPRFLSGEPLGELFYDLRREFLDQHGNPLGLLYNVYCDGDTRVQPGLTF
ncbi:MAG TPA: CHAT domain-containing protein [Gemmatimonadaceae bacterium]|nr:CHAT domain-containing protein [Gemmatimonadaceae bacterium]